MSTRITLRVAVAALIGCLAALLGAATPASAHASIVASEPVDGAALQVAPDVARIHFSEPVDERLLDVRIVAGADEEIAPQRVSVEDGGATVVVELPELDEDLYRIEYRVVDPVDLHRTAGSVVFGVGVRPGPVVPPVEPGPAIVDVLVTWAVRVGVVLALGGAMVLASSGRDARFSAARARARRVLVIAAAVTAVGELAAFAIGVLRLGIANVPLADVMLTSPSGRRVQIVVETAVAALVTLRMQRHRSTQFGDRLVLGLVVVMAGAVGWSGHAPIGGDPTVGMALHVVHLVAVAAWVGSVAVTALSSRGAPRAVASVLWAATSRHALPSALVTIGTGCVLLGRETASVTALLSTPFGRVAAMKLLLVVGLIAFGVRALRGRSGPAGRPRSGAVAGELAFASLALGAGAFLTLAVPAVGARFEPAPLPSPSTASGDVDDLTVTASIRPNRPGENLVTIAVLETRRPSLGLIEAVRVELVSPDGGVVTESATVVDGVAELGLVELGAPGELTVRVAVDRPARPVGAVDIGWVVDPRPIAPAPTVLSDAPLRRAALPLGVALLVVAAGVLTWGRRARPERPADAAVDTRHELVMFSADAPTHSVTHEERDEVLAR